MKKSTEREFVKKLDSVEKDIVTKPTFPEEQKQQFLHKFSAIKSEMKTRWVAASRTEKVFLKKNHSWLQGTVEIPTGISRNSGRPSKAFSDLCDRSKRRREPRRSE